MINRNSPFLIGNGGQIDLKLASGQLYADPDILLQRIEAGGLVTLQKADFLDSFQNDSVLTLHLLQALKLMGGTLAKNEGLLDVLNRVSAENIRSIIVKAVEKHLNETPTAPVYQVNMELNDHAREISLACSTVGQYLQYDYPGQAGLAGLLCNIGKLLLLTQAKGHQHGIFTQDLSNESLILEEKREFNTDHVAVSGELLESLNIPPEIIDAVCYGAMPYQRAVNASKLVKIVCFGNLLVNDQFENLNTVVDAGTLLLGLGSQEATDLYKIVQKKIREQDDTRADYEQQKQRLEAGLAKSSVEYLLSERIWQASDIDELASVLRDWFLTIQGVQEAIIFLPDGDQRYLKPCGSQLSHNGYLEESGIPIEPGVSLVSHCWLHQEISSTFQVEPCAEMIIDLQLIRRCQSKGFICIPVLHEGKPVSVALLGVDKIPEHSFEDTSFYLEAFTKALLRLEEKGRLGSRSGGNLPLRKIKHELSNPLTVISNKLFVLKQKHPEIASSLEQIEKEQQRIRDIIRFYLESPGENISAEPVSLNDMLLSISSEFPESRNEKMHIELELAQELPVLHLNEMACRQIFVNILRNAIEACEGTSPKGHVIVRSSDMLMIDDKYWIEVTVKDNGPGIKPEVMKNIFKPMDTTKSGDHAGLGLSIVKSLCEEINAKISCRSYQGQGAEFSVLIPRPMENL